MSKEQAELRRWLEEVTDPELSAELLSIRNEEKEVHERFYRSLEFGTGGLRGELGAGTNRMNIYTVRQATQGFAAYLLTQDEKPSAAISHDSRHKSDVFARETARVLAANGIKVYLYPHLMPTPRFPSRCWTGTVRRRDGDRQPQPRPVQRATRPMPPTARRSPAM